MATTVRLKEDETFEDLFKRFKKKVINDGVMAELRKRSYYVGPSLKRRLKSEEARKREARNNKKNIKYIIKNDD